jgi:xanthine dehydrogenase small subunit
MIQFILNHQQVSSDLHAGSTVLDYVRTTKRLSGTKTGCREGDCGACTILVGQLVGQEMQYQSMTSCLMPLGNAHGKHIVTVEGINMGENLSPVQAAMVETQGTQCGFCTIGFIMSFTGFILDKNKRDFGSAIAAIDGNICRCTGYKSIERAADIIAALMQAKPAENQLQWLVDNRFLPDYFAQIPTRIQAMQTAQVESQKNNTSASTNNALSANYLLAGGTDLLVQRPETVRKSSVNLVFEQAKTVKIERIGETIRLSGNTTATEFAQSAEIRQIFANIDDIMRRISSTPIRNMATMAGNIVNASPIGDMTAFFMALDAELELWDSLNDSRRRVKLRQFYKGYKTIDKTGAELVENIYFGVPTAGSLYNFEKVCKREHLDIASVNSACSLMMDKNGATIAQIHLSAGGVSATPKYLELTCAFLIGKSLDADTLQQAIDIMQSEIAPISDARGTMDYKRLLLRQLVLGHFVAFFGITPAIKTILQLC